MPIRPYIELHDSATKDVVVKGKQVRGFDCVLKVVVVGESGVGKSCLVGSLCEEPYIEDRSSTIGSDIRSVTLNIQRQRIRLMVWDTAGQEKFRTLTSSFYRGAHLVLLCFDITLQESFDQLQYWFDQLETSYSTSNSVVKILLGTKIDKMAQRVVNRNEAVRLAAETECACYLETSAFTGSGVKDAFEEGIRRVLLSHEFNIQTRDSSVLLDTTSVSYTKRCC